MANHAEAPFSGPESIDALVDDRMRMWKGFTSGTTMAGTVVVVILILMAVFLL